MTSRVDTTASISTAPSRPKSPDFHQSSCKEPSTIDLPTDANALLRQNRSVIPKIPGLVSTHYDNVWRTHFRRTQALALMAKGKMIPESLQQQHSQAALQTKEQLTRPVDAVPDLSSSSSSCSRSSHSNQNSPRSPGSTFQSTATNRNGRGTNGTSAATKSKTSSNFRTDSQQPRWITHDRQVLRFFGYFYQANQVLRRVVLCLYLVDHSISIHEPKTSNSGLLQGVFLRRGVIAKPNGQPFGPEDIHVGQSIRLHGTTFYLVDCDQATRKYYQEIHQLDLPAALRYPDDSQLTREQEIDAIKAKLARQRDHASHHQHKQAQIQKFLENHQKVLRFYVSWHDSHPWYAEKRHFVLHFYLIDDTIEIVETKQARRLGRGPFTTLMKRCRVPKPSSSTCGGDPDSGVHAFLTERDLRCGEQVEILSRKFLLEDCDAFTKEFYLEKHGITQESLAEITGQDHDATLHDAKGPQQDHGGNADLHANRRELEHKRVESRKFYHDNAKDKKVMRFRARFLLKPQQTTSTPGAVAGPPIRRGAPVDAEREFVLTFFLEDDTLSVFEPPLRNSGLVAGNFLKRGRFKRFGFKCTCGVHAATTTTTTTKTSGSLGTQKPTSHPVLDPSRACRCDDFEPHDFFVGARIRFDFSPQQIFEIIQADTSTLEYCESHPEVFVFSDAERIVTKVAKYLCPQNQNQNQRNNNNNDNNEVVLTSNVRSECRALDPKATHQLDVSQFRQVLSRFGIDSLLNAQELITLVRKFQPVVTEREESHHEQDQEQHQDQVAYELFCDAVASRTDLPRCQPTTTQEPLPPLNALRQLGTLRQLLSQLDTNQSGLVSIDEVLEVVRFHDIDFETRELITALRAFEAAGHRGSVKYHQLCDQVFALGGEDDTRAQTPHSSSSSSSSSSSHSASRSVKTSARKPSEHPPETVSSQLLKARSESCRDPHHDSDKAQEPAAPPAGSPRSDLPDHLSRHHHHHKSSYTKASSLSRSAQATGAKVKDDRSFSGSPSSTTWMSRVQANTTIQADTSGVSAPAVSSSSSVYGSDSASLSTRLDDTRSDRSDRSANTKTSRFKAQVIGLLQREFATRKYQLRKQLREKDTDRSGFLNEDAFMQVVLALSPTLSDDDSYLLVNQLFPRNNDAVNYPALLEQVFN